MGRAQKTNVAKSENTKITGKISRKQRNAKPGEKPDEDAPRGLGEVESADLEPIEVVRRELIRPDGSVVVVEVPVYPPFRLSEQPGGRKAPLRNRSAPTLKGKRRRKAGASES
jgi:hypothetical protein